ncbi:MAG: hypothetical protein RLZZ524_1489 [Pseudomonadota bacterium]
MKMIATTGPVPSTLQRALSHCRPMAKATITTKVMAATAIPSASLIPESYPTQLSAYRKKD